MHALHATPFALLLAIAPAIAANAAPVEPQLVLPTACLVESYEAGSADLTLTIAPDGSVASVTVDRSSGHPSLDEAMRVALAKSRAVAGSVDGAPRAMPIRVRMEANDGTFMRGGPGGYQMVVTITGGAKPRTGQYNCYGHDAHPFNPQLLAK